MVQGIGMVVRRAEFESAASSVSTRRSNRAELTAHKLTTTKVDSDTSNRGTAVLLYRCLPCQGRHRPFRIIAHPSKLLKNSVLVESRISQIDPLQHSSRQIKTAMQADRAAADYIGKILTRPVIADQLHAGGAA